MFSLQLNKVPGINAVAGVHDLFQVRLGQLSEFARNLLNFPGMIPATGLAYGALITDPALVGIVSSYQWEQRREE